MHEIVKVTGAPARSMLKTGKFAASHFDNSGNLRLSTGKIVPKTQFEDIPEPIEEDLEKLLAGVQPATVRQFSDLIERCLQVSIDQRVQPAQALEHKFLQA